MAGLVDMLFRRFGAEPLCSTMANSDASFLDRIPIRDELMHLCELDFQLGRRAEAHFMRPDGSKVKEFIINPMDTQLSPEMRNHRSTAKIYTIYTSYLEYSMPVLN